MAEVREYTYDVSTGSGTLDITDSTGENISSTITYQVEGDGSVDDAVTVQLQETNVYNSGFSSVGSSVVANTGTSEYVSTTTVTGLFLSFDIDVGIATAGIITITINFK